MSTALSQPLQRVWSGAFLGRPVVVKERFSKTYRHPTLDVKLTQQRLKAVSAGSEVWMMICRPHGQLA